MIIERIKSIGGADTVASDQKTRTILSPTGEATFDINPKPKSAKVVYPTNINSERESDKKRHASPMFTDSNDSENASIRCDDISDLQESDQDIISNSRYNKESR